MTIKDYIYLALWLLLGAYCTFAAFRMSKILFVLSGFFLFMFGWYLANDLTSFDMMSGTYGWIFRGVGLAFLIVFIILYVRYKRDNPQ